MAPRYRAYSTSPPSPNKFSYHIAASYIGKDRPYDPTTHVFHFDPHNQIHPESTRRGSRPESGHDAFFVSRFKGSSGAVAWGVADGVGGWTDSGVDPADFSHGLCGQMALATRNHETSKDTDKGKGGGGGGLLSPRQIMQQGYDAICRDGSVQAGGSTACVATASPGGTLEVANLGDSGFLQLRLNAVHASSEPQTHAFNTPFQLSLVPPSVAARMAAYGGGQLCDLPRDADISRHELRHGDVLVFATDGVLDNLFNQDVLRIASRVMVSAGAWATAPGSGDIRVTDSLAELTEPSEPSSSSSPSSTPSTAASTAAAPGKLVTLQSLLATQLVTAAKRASVNTRQDGPFAKEVQKYFPRENWHGGKVDDICVVVVVVCEDGKAIKSKL
jgi:protein phosphatase PTC7